MSDPTFTPDQVQVARNDFVAHGGSGEAFDAAMSAAPEPSPAAPEIAPAVQVDVKGPTLSPEQVALARADWTRLGNDPAEFDAAVAADGTPLPAADTRTDAQREQDEFFGPPPAATDYRPEYVGRIPHDMTPAQLADLHAQASGWLADLQVPVAIGNDLVERMIDAGHRYKAMEPAERGLWEHEQRIELERLAKSPERAAELKALAEAALARSPAFSKEIEAYGVFLDAGVLVQLGLNEERRRTRVL